MHFAYPPRKDSNPRPFRPKSSSLPVLRRSRVKSIALFTLVVVSILWIGSKVFSESSSPGSNSWPQRGPSGNPPVVIVTVVDEEGHGKAHAENIRKNREEYAARHGYETMIAHPDDYDLDDGLPSSWAKVVALRHATSKFPECGYLWYVDQDSLIMDASASLEERVLRPNRLQELMMPGTPVVREEGIVKTLSLDDLPPENVELVLSQDRDGFSLGSFVVRNGEWAKFLFETWFSPLYLSYNFQKAEVHALEHAVQWHSTILARLGLVQQDALNSYTRDEKTKYVYKPGDLVVRAADCVRIGEGENTCENELAGFDSRWREAFGES